MTLCSKGHELIVSPTAKRKRCLTCKADHMRAKRREQGVPTFNSHIEACKAVTAGRIEDIEDLLGFGATFQEVFTRSGYKNTHDMYRALRNAGKAHIVDALKRIK